MTKEEEPRLIKISFEYDDHIDELEGDDLKRWEKAMNGIITLAWSHRMVMPSDLKMKRIEKRKHHE